MNRYSTYIFDLDGTLTDTTAVWLAIFRDALTHFGVTPPDTLTLSKHTHDWKEMITLGLPEEKLEAFTELAHKLAKERLPDAPMHNGSVEMLERLQKAGKTIGIFSTMDRPLFEPAMEHHRLARFAKAAVAGTDVPRRKPHPDGIIKTLEYLQIPESEYSSVIYIGDKDTDIQAAHNAGVKSMLFYPPSHQEIYTLESLTAHNPTHIIHSWEELTV